MLSDMPNDLIRRINVLGVGVSAINLEMALGLVDNALRERRKGYICLAGVHGISEAQSDRALLNAFNRAFLCTPDGMPLVWIGRLKGEKNMARVYGPDLMLSVLEMSEKRGYRHFFYGGANGTVKILCEKLLNRFPKLQVAGIYEPPFRPLSNREQEDLKEKVAASCSDMMWIGIGTPKQDKFMAEYLPLLDVTLMAGVGAAFDFHAGKVRQAPLWMQRSGLEWFYRLCAEPRRLWKRYFKNIPLFGARFFCQIAGLKKYPLPSDLPGTEKSV
jgi:N-acetylglucosaminyldiphosphoundecaprenol N-acetyl-beta-D-mannosaminyltransferase